MNIQGEPDKEEREEGGGVRRMVLVALLIVLALFGYLYLFTDLIRSHTEPSQAARAPLRKPLPRKDDAMGRLSSSVRPSVAPSSGGPVAAPVRQGERPLPAKPHGEAAVPGAAAAPPKKTATVAHDVPPARPVPVTSDSRKSVPVKPPSPQKASLPAAATVAAPPAPSGKGAAAPAASYAIQCGPFVSSREMKPARTLLMKEGLRPRTAPGPKRQTPMYRLFVAKHQDAAVAAQELKKLLEVTPDAFVLPRDGASELFGGSYHEERRARIMLSRLNARGISAELRQATAPVPTRWLSAGALPSREAADALAARLKKNGIACNVIKHDR